MINFIYIFSSWLFFLVILSTLFLLFFWMWSSIKSKVPFIPVASSIMNDIDSALELKDGSIVYDLGCGDGRVLFNLYKKYPNVKYIGIENNPFPLFLARINNWWHKKIYKSNIEIINADFFDVNLSKATHIFTYLYPNIMDDLISKLDTELSRGTRMVSVSFHFTSKREVKEIDLKRSKYKLSRKIYVYEF